MGKIARKKSQIFGGSLTSTDNIAVFGSLKAGSAAYSLDLDTVQSTAYLNGWAAAVVNNDAPCLQDMNALFYALSYQIAYLMQSGVPEWVTTGVYYIGSIVTPVGDSGNLFSSRTNDNTGNALTDPVNWIPIVQNGVGAVTGPTATCDCMLFSNFEAAAGAGGNKTFTIDHMQNGMTVNLVVLGAVGNTVSFTLKDPDNGALTGRGGSTYSNTMINGLSIFTLYRSGSYVYISAIHGLS